MHDLIKDNQIVKSHDFNSQTPPILHANKGKWVPRTTIDPDYDPAKQTKSLTKTVNEDSTVWEYVVSDIPLETIKATKLAEIRSACDQQIAMLSSSFSETEKSSWTDQEKSAVAYTADHTTSVPLLTAIAETRGITLADLVSRVLINAAAFKPVYGGIIGKQQGYEDQINNAVDADVVLAVVWE